MLYMSGALSRVQAHSINFLADNNALSEAATASKKARLIAHLITDKRYPSDLSVLKCKSSKEKIWRTRFDSRNFEEAKIAQFDDNPSMDTALEDGAPTQLKLPSSFNYLTSHNLVDVDDFSFARLLQKSFFVDCQRGAVAPSVVVSSTSPPPQQDTDCSVQVQFEDIPRDGDYISSLCNQQSGSEACSDSQVHHSCLAECDSFSGLADANWEGAGTLHGLGEVGSAPASFPLPPERSSSLDANEHAMRQDVASATQDSCVDCCGPCAGNSSPGAAADLGRGGFYTRPCRPVNVTVRDIVNDTGRDIVMSSETYCDCCSANSASYDDDLMFFSDCINGNENQLELR